MRLPIRMISPLCNNRWSVKFDPGELPLLPPGCPGHPRPRHILQGLGCRLDGAAEVELCCRQVWKLLCDTHNLLELWRHGHRVKDQASHALGDYPQNRSATGTAGDPPLGRSACDACTPRDGSRMAAPRLRSSSRLRSDGSEPLAGERP
jgi:hypothetical protein